MSDLVATESDVPAQPGAAVAGAGIIESYNGLALAIESGNWIDASVAGLGAALETVGAVIDPIGTLASAGVGWLIEHVQPLQDALDMLAGNPDLVEAHAMTWDNIANEYFAISAEMEAFIDADIESWDGLASDAYREKGDINADALGCLGGTALSLATATRGAGELVTMVREFVRDFVAECIGSLIAWAAEVAFTVGVGAAWVIPKAVVRITEWVGKIFGWITGLIDSVSALRDLLFG
ncbi:MULTISPECIES: hypothetical protein [Glycomyces]|uniref:Uncharacterized protein YukE n=2 Tax=Glycomyces TaxID=58113 RepID=A0A9X3PIH6_9ACTN|nr:hypothetical protein [Glycomyces lechevalierae]MDA1384303.1 hypothetical protein [Glycomyces lechevalierae]MDR7339266.1 uncharacterized protein YukE [Glycomyces lechevalierae]